MIAAYRRTHSPSQVAWSEGWQPLVRCAAIHQMNRVNSHNGLWSWWHHYKYRPGIIIIIIIMLLLLLLTLWHSSLGRGLHSTECYSIITGCTVAQLCYIGDVRFLWEKLELWPPVKFKPLNRLSQNLSQLITSTRGTFVPSLLKIRSRGTSGQIGEMSLSCDFIYLFYFFSEASAEIKPFDWFWRMMAQNAWNHARICLFGVKIFNFNIWPLFTPKMSNFAPQIAISSHHDETLKSKYIRNY